MGNHAAYEMIVTLKFSTEWYGQQWLTVTLEPHPEHIYRISIWHGYMDTQEEVHIGHHDDINGWEELYSLVLHDVLNNVPFPDVLQGVTWENYVN